MSTWSAQSCLDSHLQDCARNPRQAVLAVETLTDLWGLLGSCFRRNDECWIFAQSRKQEANPPSFLRRRLCKKPSPSRVTCGKPLRVWLFFWVPAFETVQKTHHPWSHSHYCPNSPTLLAFQTNTPCLQKYPIMTVINLQTLA